MGDYDFLIEVHYLKSGDTVQFNFTSETFKILGRSIELFFTTTGSVSMISSSSSRERFSEGTLNSVYLMIMAEFGISGSEAASYAEQARAAYVDPARVRILEIKKRTSF